MIGAAVAGAAGAGAAGAALLAAGAWTLRRRLVVVTVRGPSMEPTLRHGDRLLVRVLPPHRLSAGQVVVLADGSGAHEWIVKRLAALPGDPVPHDRVPSITDARVPPGCLILFGDNPERSRDSRDAGYFATGSVLGAAVRRLPPRSPRSVRAANSPTVVPGCLSREESLGGRGFHRRRL
ncbi:S26 family signal peptidase [Actinomadura sp. 9N215]|uniref:S26 family signal peptidase n=1 Tax=Actinomadura sp. 9N215 TaxID=3375150 RepID=UPI0037B52F89